MSEALAFAATAMATWAMADLRAALPRKRGRPAIATLTRMVPARLRPPLDLAARLEAAGAKRIGVAEFMAIKTTAAAGGGFFGLLAAASAPGRLGLVLLVAAAPAGFVAPDAFLSRRIRERVAAARRDLPAVLDLLRVAVDAGLSPPRALAEIGARSAAPLAADLAAAAAEVELGVPLSEALDGLARRVPADEIRSFSAAIQRASLHGAPLGPTLAAQARDARSARSRRIQESAAKAAPKIQLVVALLLVPSVLLLVAAALLAALLDGNVGSSIG